MGQLFSGSYEPSPRLTDQFRHDDMDPDFSLGPRESQLREDLADAMRESPSVSRDATGEPSQDNDCNVVYFDFWFISNIIAYH